MIALDLFAGTGWGVACQALGIDEHGVEIMPRGRGDARGERHEDDLPRRLGRARERPHREPRRLRPRSGGSDGGATGGAEVFGRRSREAMNNAERVTVAEAAALQSYPPGFTFAGTKTKQFLQVGNAVPPLLAEAILRAVIS